MFICRKHNYFWVFIICFVLAAANNVVTSDITGLQALFDSTNGTNWIWKPVAKNGPVWNFIGAVNPCHPIWQGLDCICTSNVCTVTEIDLEEYGLNGALPSNITLLSSLKKLKLNGNKLSSKIPSELVNMTSLTQLSLSGNSKITGSIPVFSAFLENIALADTGIKGTIPTSLLLSSRLTTIELYHNKFGGTMPSFFSEFNHLQYLRLGSCDFTGSVPIELGTLVSLTKFDFSQNHLNGTIPASFVNLVNMRDIFLGHNDFTGQFPSVVLSMTNLQTLSLGACSFTGSLPQNLGTLTLMQLLTGNRNNFGGTIPSSIGNMLHLTELDFSENDLTGMLPTSLSQLSNMVWLYFIENKLGGEIPATFFQNMTSLDFADLCCNYFTGTFPSGISNAVSLHYLDFSSNYLTGGLPTSIGSIVPLTGLMFSYNMLTGTLPSFVCENQHLEDWSLSSNMMYGTIPECIGDSLGSLKNFELEQNQFSGMLPQSLSKLTALRTLLLTGNRLSGPIGEYSLPANLITVDLSSNAFSGPLPLFSFTSELMTFAASDNCFSGSISDEICNAINLVVLVLNGIGSARVCSTVVFDITHKVYFSNYLDGDIPSCIFNLPALKSLYLTGNGLSGVLPDLPPTTEIRNLSLSFNRFRGTIPDSIQSRVGSFRNLDLSYNRLSGTLDATLYEGEKVKSAYVALSSNRLSGSLPQSLLNKSLSNEGVTLRILAGNVFDCAIFDPNLPDDPDATHYICGSNILNVTTTMYALAFFALSFGFGVTVKRIVRHSNSSDNKFWHELMALIIRYLICNEHCEATSTGIRTIARMLALFRFCAMAIAVIAMIILLPAYLTIKSLNSGAFSQFTHQYGWRLSLGFMSGVGPAIVVAVLWWICIVVVAYMLAQYHVLTVNIPVDIRNTALQPVSTTDVVFIMQRIYSCRYQGLFLLLNAIVVCTVNALYVVVLLYESTIIQFFVSALIIAFKLSWNPMFVMPLSTKLALSDTVVVMTMIFNNILVPVLASIAVDVSCLQNLFVIPEVVKYSYSYSMCSLFYNTTCVFDYPVVTSASQDPPFMYSYQCSSSMLRNYIPIYIIMYAFVGIGIPLGRLAVLLYFHAEAIDQSTSSNSLSAARPVSADLAMLKSVDIHSYIEKRLDAANRKATWLMYIKNNMWTVSVLSCTVVSRLCLPIQCIDEVVQCWSVSEKTQCLSKSAPAVRIKPIYNLKRNLLGISVALVVQMTFGLAYPPLAFVIAMYIASSTLVIQACIHTHSVQVSNLVSKPENLRSGFSSDDIMERWDDMLQIEANSIYQALFGSTSVVVAISGLFLALFLVDMTCYYTLGLISICVSFAFVIFNEVYDSKGSYDSSLTGQKNLAECKNIEMAPTTWEGVVVPNPLHS